MNNNKIKTLQKKIKLYYKKKSRLLPWRVHNGNKQDPYKTLISEIMLQQTRVQTVLKYYKSFLKEFPNIKALALTNEENVKAKSNKNNLGIFRNYKINNIICNFFFRF